MESKNAIRARLEPLTAGAKATDNRERVADAAENIAQQHIRSWVIHVQDQIRPNLHLFDPAPPPKARKQTERAAPLEIGICASKADAVRVGNAAYCLLSRMQLTLDKFERQPITS